MIIDSGAFVGEQGPFEDAIAGATDSSGWVYDLAPTFCFRCGEQEMEIGVDAFCWNCDPVPPDWEEDHETALQMVVGILQAH